MQVRGQLGIMHPWASFREVNNSNGAQRSGVALQHKENGNEKGKNSKGKGHK